MEIEITEQRKREIKKVTYCCKPLEAVVEMHRQFIGPLQLDFTGGEHNGIPGLYMDRYLVSFCPFCDAAIIVVLRTEEI